MMSGQDVYQSFCSGLHVPSVVMLSSLVVYCLSMGRRPLSGFLTQFWGFYLWLHCLILLCIVGKWAECLYLPLCPGFSVSSVAMLS